LPRLITDHLLTASGRAGCRLYSLTGLGLFTLWQGYQWQWALHLPAIITVMVALGLIYMGLCLINQRLHDFGRSGWWTGAIFAGLLGVWLMPNSPPALLPLSLLGLIIALGVVPGDKGHNRYGPRPNWKRSSLSTPEPEVRPSSPDQTPFGRTI
jgi:uncharacterized membrane protein YhaH (DUF805 family)